MDTPNETRPFSQSPKKGLRWDTLLRCLGLVGFVCLLPYIDFSRVVGEISQIRLEVLAVAATLVGVLVLLRAIRWNLLMRSLGIRERFVVSSLVYGDSVFWGTLTPGRLGEFCKLQHLQARHGVNLVRGAAWAVLDRFFDLAVVVLLFAWAATDVVLADLHWLRPVAFLGAIGLIVWIPARHFLLARLMAQADRLPKFITARVLPVLRDLDGISLWSIALAALLTFASLSCNIGVIYALSRSFSFALSYPEVALCVICTLVVGMLPVSYLNFGSREITLLVLFRSFGRSAEEAISFSFLFVLTYLLLIVITSQFALLARRVTTASPA